MVGGIREFANHESECGCCNVQYIILHNILYYSNDNYNNEMLLKNIVSSIKQCLLEPRYVQET